MGKSVVRVPITIRTSRREKGFDRLQRRIRSNAGSAAYNYARGVVALAKEYAPVDTGYMKSQIKWKRNGRADFLIYVDGSVNAETGAFYAIYVEYGTRYMAAQPFFRPAVEHMKAKFRRDMRAVFR